MVVRFHVVAPAAKQRTFTVRLPILLGRGDEAKFRIQHDLVSRRHCELFERGGQVYVRDLGSTNGTFLNDEQVPVSTKTKVPPGGIVRVGGLAFSVEYQTTAAEHASPAVGETGHSDDGASTEESRVDGNAESLEEQPDFRVEHMEEDPVAFPEDAVARDDAAGESGAAAEGGAAGVAEAGPADAEKDAFRPPEAAGDADDTVAESPAQPDGFGFLAAADASSPAAEAPQWPVAADDAADDAPDDDQLNAFFKGLK